MPEYNLFMGGVAGNTDNRLVPSQNPCLIEGYADHQRLRSYAVNRQLDFRPRVPFGGLTGPVDQKDYCWYQALLATDTDVEVGDFLHCIVITPYSRLEFVEVNVVLPVNGLQLAVMQRTNACGGSPTSGSVTFTAGTNSVLDDGDLGDTAGIFYSTRIDSSLLLASFISFEVIAVPTVTAPAGVLDNLFIFVQAEVVDWGSYDFNGNA
jgi:hypothetical protein